MKKAKKVKVKHGKFRPRRITTVRGSSTPWFGPIEKLGVNQLFPRRRGQRALWAAPMGDTFYDPNVHTYGGRDEEGKRTLYSTGASSVPVKTRDIINKEKQSKT